MEEEKLHPKNVPENAPAHCPGTDSSEAGQAAPCAGCPNQDICKSGQGSQKQDPGLQDIRRRMQLIKHQVLVLSGKGGVGKSTVSSQLAFILAQMDFQVGLLDIDICGPSIPRMLGMEKQEIRSSNEGWSPVYANDNLGVMSIGFLLPDHDQAVVWRGPRKNGLIKQFLTDVAWGELDFLIIDTPPGTSDEHISLAQYLQLTDMDGAVLVTTPQEVSLADVRKEISFCKKTSINILGVVQNMSGFICPHCDQCSEIFPPITGGARQMCEDYHIDLLGQIPLEPQILLSAQKGKCILNEAPTSEAAKNYQLIVENIIKKIQKKQ